MKILQFSHIDLVLDLFHFLQINVAMYTNVLFFLPIVFSHEVMIKYTDNLGQVFFFLVRTKKRKRKRKQNLGHVSYHVAVLVIAKEIFFFFSPSNRYTSQ